MERPNRPTFTHISTVIDEYVATCDPTIQHAWSVQMQYQNDIEQFHQQSRDAAILWARDLMSRDDWICLDTETSGLLSDAEIVQVGMLSASGRVILDVLVKPQRPIPEQATAIHGITNEDVADALTFDDVLSAIFDKLRRCEVVIYNADYDTRLVRQSIDACGLCDFTIPDMRVTCAMLQYAAFVGEYNSYRGTYKWPRLPSGDHSAIGDAKATLAIIKEMAAAELSVEVERRLAGVGERV